MTIRFVQQWNGYSPDTIVTLAGAEETRLIGLGYAVTDLDGPGNTPLPVTSTTNLTGRSVFSEESRPTQTFAPAFNTPLTMPTISAIGDSWTGTRSYSQSGSGVELTKVYGVQSWLHWSLFLSGQRQRCIFPATGGSGSGQNSTQIKARLADFTAIQPTFLAILAGINDLSGCYTLAQANSAVKILLVNLKEMYDTCLAAGIFPLPVMVPSFTAAANSPDDTITRYAVLNANAWIDAYAKSIGLSGAINLETYWATEGAINANMSGDELHPLVAGAAAVGKSGYKILAEISPPVDLSTTSTVFANPTLTGVGGTVSTGGSGTAPDSWRIKNSGAGTIAGALANGVYSFTCNDVADAGASLLMEQRVIDGSCTTGDTIEAFVDISLAAGGVGIYDFKGTLQAYGSTSYRSDGMATSVATDYLNTTSQLSGRLYIPKLTISSGVNGTTQKDVWGQIFCRMNAVASSAGVIKVSSFYGYKI